MFQNEERKATAERIRSEARVAYVNVRRVLSDPAMSGETRQNARAMLVGTLLRAADRIVSLVREEFSAKALRVAGDLRHTAGSVLKGEPLVSAARTDKPVTVASDLPSCGGSYVCGGSCPTCVRDFGPSVEPVRTPHPEVSAPIPAGTRPDLN